MKKILAILIFLPLFTFGQQYNSEVMQQMKELALQQIKQLHDGCLLVRLPQNKLAVKALVKAGKTATAEKLKSDLNKMNHNIVTAFNSYFDFCPVYYFYAEHSDSILNKNFSGIILDSNFQIIEAPLLMEKKFFVVEICKTVPDTLMLRDSYKYRGTNSDEEIKKKIYYEACSNHMNSLVIKSDRFIQLSKPFPFKKNILFTDGMPKAKKIKRAVNKINAKLYNYYQ
ncbi:MAG: hypothetical protein ABI723_20700 [Bacteroidia bacterium]